MKQGHKMKGRHMGPPPGRGRGGGGRRRGRHPEPPMTSTEELQAWFAGNIPDDWFTDPVQIRFDRDEVIVTGALAKPKLDKGGDEELAARARAILANGELISAPSVQTPQVREGIVVSGTLDEVAARDLAADLTSVFPVKFELELSG